MSNARTDGDTPVIHAITRVNGVAGQYAYVVRLTYPGQAPDSVTLTSNVSGGPIVLGSSSGMQVFVSRDVLDRIGSVLTPDWVRAFFGPHE